VSAERTIEMAEEALRANEPASASELSESAARELAHADRRRHTALRLARYLPTVPVPEVRGTVTPDMEVLFHHLAHGRARLSELEDL